MCMIVLDYCYLVEDRAHWRPVVTTVMNVRCQWRSVICLECMNDRDVKKNGLLLAQKVSCKLVNLRSEMWAGHLKAVWQRLGKCGLARDLISETRK